MTINSTTMEYQKVIDYIFQMIKDRKLIVGSKIPSERDIAEQLGIGRNSTREAISLMRGMGLIESRHGSGNYIAKNSDRTISNIVSVMLALGSISMKDILEFRKIISRTVIELIFINGLEDNEKEYIKKTIDNLVKDHTVIIVAHRLSTIVDADVINIIDKGKLESFGTHDELLKKSKVYQTLYSNETSNSIEQASVI